MPDALGTFAEFHERPVLTFRNGSYMYVNNVVLRADAVRAAIESIENIMSVEKFDEIGIYAGNFDDWIDVKDAGKVFMEYDNFNTQKIDEFLSSI